MGANGSEQKGTKAVQVPKPLGAGSTIFGFLLIAMIIWVVCSVGMKLWNHKLLAGLDDWKKLILFFFPIPFIALLSVTAGIAERFVFFTKGRVFGALGYLFGSSSLGISLEALRDWNNDSPNEDGVIPHEMLLDDYANSLHLTDLERKDFSKKRPFSQWMVAEIVTKYENNAQGFAYLGAALLIGVIGLRGVDILKNENVFWIILALQLEFSLIALLGLLIFFKPEEKKQNALEPVQPPLPPVPPPGQVAPVAGMHLSDYIIRIEGKITPDQEKAKPQGQK
jgi:hypothetical protein